MSSVRITKEFSFEMAHALDGHDGPCRFIHGHSYLLSVTILGIPSPDETSPKLGMLMDFSDLKAIIRKQILDLFDHALVLKNNNQIQNRPSASALFERTLWVEYQPTSENLLLDFVKRIRPFLPEGVMLHSMKLRETATSYAEWFAEDNR